MPNIADIIERRNSFSDRLSSQVRFISIGILATTWGFLVGTTSVAISNEIKEGLIIAALLSITSLFFDFLQYFFGYQNIVKLLKEMEATNSQNENYKCDILYKLSNFLFWVKQFFMANSVILFVIFAALTVV